jgi:hypothetical protein
LLRHDSGGDVEWWVLLTPACDLQHEGKADFALLGRASLLVDNSRYKAWRDAPSKGTWNQLNDLLIGKKERYYYLPEFRDIPDLILDLEDTKVIPIDNLKGFARIASLVAPYSDALLAQNSHFRGRIGTPDLNSISVKKRLSEQLGAEV